ncbi:MAG: TIM barrel protein [Anaerolineae bacterium]|jgi:xylose isomerase|nr:TIM barrel protein [Anaerolineae bacterium]
MEKYGYKFSFGPWNIHEGADPFGPPVRPSISFDQKLEAYQRLGFDAVQFHDDDAIPDLDDKSPDQIVKEARALKQRLDAAGLVAEFVAPRLWEHPITVDGAYTSNDPKARAYAIERSHKTLDIANTLETGFVVLWFAREGTYQREAKDAARAVDLLAEALDDMLAYAPNMRIAIEPKPNEPMDISYIPTIGHAVALGYKTRAPERCGVLVESAHAVLAGLDPADEMAFGLAYDKLWSVHLNDQNGLKFDQDRAFGSVNLRRAFDQVLVLDDNRFYEKGIVGLDVKAVRTQKPEVAEKHLINSRDIFLWLVERARSLDRKVMQQCIDARDYEELDRLILEHLMTRG